MFREEEKGFTALGSFTIEASLIFPFVLLVIVACIYLSFYLYDRCMAEAEMEKALVELTMGLNQTEISQGEMMNEQKQEKMEELETTVRAKALLFQSVSGEFIESGSKGTIRLRTSWMIPFPFVSDVIGAKSLEMEKQRRLYQPTQTVRIGAMIYESIRDTKAYEKISQYIESKKELLE